MAGWQPIETAPRDGSEVILSDGHSVGAGFWHDGSGCFRAGEGTFWEMDRGSLSTARNAGATHWMPLPEPPSVLPLAEGGEG